MQPCSPGYHHAAVQVPSRRAYPTPPIRVRQIGPIEGKPKRTVQGCMGRIRGRGDPGPIQTGSDGAMRDYPLAGSGDR
jgi:hypothetical protein